MNYLRSPVVSWPVAGAVLLGSGAAVLGGVLGCQSVLGIHDVSLDPAGAGGSSASSGNAGSGGQGGQTTGFAFAIKDTIVNVPYGGLNYVNIELTPSGGFSGAVDVTVQGAPTGFVVMPLTIPAGSTTGRLQVGAGTTLVLDTKFTLTLMATSGSISKTAAVPAVVTGKPGDLDNTFGSGGLVTGPTASGAAFLNDIREVAQGKILVGGLNAGKLGGGTAIELRFLPNGMPDTSFNMTGSASDAFAQNCSCGEGGVISVAREVDGTLLFIGWGKSPSPKNDDIYLFRRKNDGIYAAVQGDNGVEDIDLGGSEEVAAAALVPSSNNVIVVGSKDNALFVTRVADRQAFGAPDTTFAAPKGFIVPPLGGTSSSASALTIDAMGRIVVTGWITTANVDDLVLLRLGADGTLDSSFGSGGVVNLARPGNQRESSVLVQPDGAIVVATTTDEGASPELLVQRFLPSGAVDTTFGTMGAVLAPLGKNTDAGSGPALMVRMLDGRLVVASNGVLGATSGPVFARFFPDGSLDPTFGTGGELSVYVGMYGGIRAMSLASDGKLLIAGSNGTNPGASHIGRLWN